MWLLQAIVLRSERYDAIVLSQLASNTFSRITPGGGATGTALQARMLADAHFDLTLAATAVTVQSLMVTAALVALPVFVIPGVLTGTALPESLLQAAWVGVVVFAVMVAVGTVLLATRRPVCVLGNWIERITNLFRFRRPKITGLGERLLLQRDEIRASVGSKWIQAVSASVGRWGFEYLVLLLALYAIDAKPNPWSVLLAFVVASVLTMIPITPGVSGSWKRVSRRRSRPRGSGPTPRSRDAPLPARVVLASPAGGGRGGLVVPSEIPPTHAPRAIRHNHAMIDIYDPAGYVASPQHETFARLRREQPVFRQPMPDGTFYWAVLRHADVVAVPAHPKCSRPRSVASCSKTWPPSSSNRPRTCC